MAAPGPVDFWRFVVERQRIWHRRHVQGLPLDEWTDDPILAKYHFTNIYRELDPGTQYIVDQLAEHNLSQNREPAPLEDSVINVMAYRLGLHEDSHAALGWLRAARFDREHVARVLGAMENPWTPAYITSNYQRTAPKNVVIADVLADAADNMPAIAEGLRNARGWEEGHAAISDQYGWGTFTGFQALVDLTYPLPEPLDPDGCAVLPHLQAGRHPAVRPPTVVAGPGTKRGLKLLFPDAKPEQYDSCIGHLSHTSRWWFAYHEATHLLLQQGRPLSKPNICNCLCEYSKYHRIRERGGYGRLYKPST